MFDLCEVDLNEIVLLGHLGEFSLGTSPLVAGLAFEYGRKVRDCVRYVVEWTPLVHANLTDSAIASQNYKQVTIGVVKQLHLVEKISAIQTVGKINFCQVAIVWVLLLVVIHLVLFFLLYSNVEGDVVRLLVIFNHFFVLALLCFSKQQV